MGIDMKDADQVMVVGSRRSASYCMAKVVRALLVCARVTIKVLADKADISEDTARRAMAGLQREGLVKREALRNLAKEFVYAWVGTQE